MKLIHVILALLAVSSVFGQKSPAAGQKGSNAAQGGSQQVSDAKLKQLESGYKSSKASYMKKPKDTKLKKGYVDATFAVGLGRMYSVSLPPRAKYSTALGAFREVLKVDPKHKGARENYDMIAKIYKQMGRPVPGEK
jgi:hypothetical protein